MARKKEAAEAVVEAVVETPVEAAEAAPKKTAARKTTTRKTASKKTAETAEVKEAEEAAVKKTAARKTTTRKTAAKKAEAEVNVYIQYNEKETAAKDILEAVKASFAEKNPETEIKTIEIYVKPEEGVAYYVVNGQGADDFKIVL